MSKVKGDYRIFGRLEEGMKIKEIMTRDVEVIQPDATIQEAAQKMKDLDVGAIPVCDGRRLKGMITDRDITIRATAMGADPSSTRVKETMTSEIYYCFENTSIDDAAILMMEKQIRRLPVINDDKDLIGIVSLGDISVDVEDDEFSGATLEEISKPSKPDR
jgi:CBS domain-containing protein